MEGEGLEHLGQVDTTHTVRIEWTGSKNASSTAADIGIDALDITGALTGDVVTPVTTSDTDTAWHRSAVSVSLVATDDVAGVRNTFYRLDGGSVTTYTAPLSVSGDRVHDLDFWSTDIAGNTEAAKSTVIRIDSTRPATTDNASSSWISGPVHVTLSSSDALSGVSGIRYVVDGSEVATYGAPVPVTGEGTHTLTYAAVDAAGNTEATKTATVRIDQNAPESLDNAQTDWVSSPVHVTLSSSDALSGVSGIRYVVDGSEVATYGAPVPVTGEGTHTLTYSAVDAAGNTEATKTATVRIDDTAPATTSNAVASYQVPRPLSASSLVTTFQGSLPPDGD